MKDFDSEFPYVEITWADHYSEFKDGFSMEELQKMVETPCIRKSVGYLVADSKRQIAIAGTIEDDGTCSEIFVCMKKAIIKKKVMEEK